MNVALPHSPAAAPDGRPETGAAPARSADLAAFLARHQRLVVLTGAGCSTESGIPDYRDPAGEWKHRKPMTFREFTGSAAARRRYWARSAIGWRRIAEARPNPAHQALARLEDAGRLHLLVTQNVDGLHQKAGSRNVVDLHGRLDRVECLGCRTGYRRDHFQEELQRLNPGWLAGVRLDPTEPGVGAAGAPERPVSREGRTVGPGATGADSTGRGAVTAAPEEAADEVRTAGRKAAPGTAPPAGPGPGYPDDRPTTATRRSGAGPSSARTRPDGDVDLVDADYDAFRLPPCPRCGGDLKPAVVFFGEPVPRRRTDRAFAAVAEADAVLSVGSSLMVWSGYRFAREAVRQSKPLALLNLGRTRADGEASLKIEARCGELLPAAVASAVG